MEQIQPNCMVNPPPKSKGETYEGLAFTFCKAATIILFTQKFALPVASGGAAVLYLLADWHGKKDTRCVLGRPKTVAAFWGIVFLAWAYFYFKPLLHH